MIQTNQLLSGRTLTLGFAFQGFPDDGDGFDQRGVDHIGGRPGTAVAGIGELQDADRRPKAQRGQLEQPVGRLDLTVPPA